MSVSPRRASLFHVADVLISAASPHRVGGLLLAAFAATACSDGPTSPKQVAVAGTVQADRSTGDTPNYNLEVILRGNGFGHVKFRQPANGDTHTVFLGVWVRDLEPNTTYLLQRAVDTILDGICTSTVWVTLGFNSPGSFTTDDKGTGTADFFRTFPAAMAGLTFDIHFRVVRQDTPKAAVLTSECYQYTIL